MHNGVTQDAAVQMSGRSTNWFVRKLSSQHKKQHPTRDAQASLRVIQQGMGKMRTADRDRVDG